MDIFQDLLSKPYIQIICRRLNDKYMIKNKNILHPELLRKQIIKMSPVIYDITCKYSNFLYAEQLERATQYIIENYAEQNGLFLPKFKPKRFRTPQDYQNMDVYNEYKTVLADKRTISRAEGDEQIRKYRLNRHVEKDVIDGMPGSREFGYIAQRTQNFANAPLSLTDWEWKLDENSDDISAEYSRVPNGRSKIHYEFYDAYQY